MPSISVIIPTYNRAKYLPRAIDSVLSQTHRELELIVVDDASTDSTQNLVANYKDPRIKYVKKLTNDGVSKSRNTGISKASHNWIAFLDSDDEWLPEKLEKQLSFSGLNSNIKIIHTNENWFYNGKPKKQLPKHKKYGGHIFKHCLPLCCIGPSTVMIHKDVLSDVGLFDESFVVCEDYDLWLRVCHKYQVGLIEEHLVNKYAGHDDQLSFNHKAMDYWRVKALEPFFREPVFSGFSFEIQAKLKNIMLQKCELLLSGYKKHGNMEKLAEVELLARTCLLVNLTDK